MAWGGRAGAVGSRSGGRGGSVRGRGDGSGSGGDSGGSGGSGGGGGGGGGTVNGSARGEILAASRSNMTLYAGAMAELMEWHVHVQAEVGRVREEEMLEEKRFVAAFKKWDKIMVRTMMKKPLKDHWVSNGGRGGREGGRGHAVEYY